MKKIYKVLIKNISIDGLCIEVEASAPKIKSQIMIEFIGVLSTVGLGMIKASIQWITPIENHAQDHQLIGVQFDSEVSPSKRKKIEDYISTLLKDRWY